MESSLPPCYRDSRHVAVYFFVNLFPPCFKFPLRHYQYRLRVFFLQKIMIFSSQFFAGHIKLSFSELVSY
jgi:TRAP-type C4-dicarboxylate transport system permease small subunit